MLSVALAMLLQAAGNSYPDFIPMGDRIWVQVSQGREGASYVEISSLGVNRRREVSLWVMTDHRYNRSVPYRRSMDFVTFHCGEGMATSIEYVKYFADGRLHSSGDYLRIASAVVPGSVGESQYEAVCNGGS